MKLPSSWTIYVFLKVVLCKCQGHSLPGTLRTRSCLLVITDHTKAMPNQAQHRSRAFKGFLFCITIFSYCIEEDWKETYQNINGLCLSGDGIFDFFFFSLSHIILIFLSWINYRLTASWKYCAERSYVSFTQLLSVVTSDITIIQSPKPESWPQYSMINLTTDLTQISPVFTYTRVCVCVCGGVSVQIHQIHRFVFSYFKNLFIIRMCMFFYKEKSFTQILFWKSLTAGEP